ncbi:neurofilament heavy polypeptide-like [Montipora capricornis]|uniref:neurofilament heavy polypeptide-like n=1 Tax=Montipora capricornis TaxID=246305 RepID=UPI0035F1D2EE
MASSSKMSNLTKMQAMVEKAMEEDAHTQHYLQIDDFRVAPPSKKDAEGCDTRETDQTNDDDADEEHLAASWPSESDTEAPKKAGKADSSKRRASRLAEVETPSKEQKKPEKKRKSPKKQAAIQGMMEMTKEGKEVTTRGPRVENQSVKGNDSAQMQGSNGQAEDSNLERAQTPEPESPANDGKGSKSTSSSSPLSVSQSSEEELKVLVPSMKGWRSCVDSSTQDTQMRKYPTEVDTLISPQAISQIRGTRPYIDGQKAAKEAAAGKNPFQGRVHCCKGLALSEVHDLRKAASQAMKVTARVTKPHHSEEDEEEEGEEDQGQPENSLSPDIPRNVPEDLGSRESESTNIIAETPPHDNEGDGLRFRSEKYPT